MYLHLFWTCFASDADEVWPLLQQKNKVTVPKYSKNLDFFLTVLDVAHHLCFFLTRISQDLAKDLAMLAREIHDVAGEIDSVSPAATDPGALVQTTNCLHSRSARPSLLHSTDGQSALFSAPARGTCVRRQRGRWRPRPARHRRCGVQWTVCSAATKDLRGAEQPLYPQTDLEPRGCECSTQSSSKQ